MANQTKAASLNQHIAFSHSLFIFSTLDDKQIFFFFQLWALASHHNPQQLILQALGCDHEVQQGHLK